jgi:anti-sigma factor RsiW
MTTDTQALSCRELVELVTDYLEGALDEVDLARFEQHLAGCSKCQVYLAQLRQTIRVAGTLSPEDLSPEAEEVLLQAFRNWRRS